MKDLFGYDMGRGVEAFTSMCGAVLPYPVIMGHQIHSDKVAVIDRPGLTRDDLKGYDAFITNLPVAIAARTADCIPALLYDPVRRAVAAVHSGWRGTHKKIVQKAVSAMMTEYGTNPGDLVAQIGPGICFDSFQVGKELVDMFSEAGFPMDVISRYDGEPESGSMNGGYHIDLKAAIEWSLEGYGVKRENIRCCDICTYLDTRFHSARREGEKCGRNINVIKLV